MQRELEGVHGGLELRDRERLLHRLGPVGGTERQAHVVELPGGRGMHRALHEIEERGDDGGRGGAAGDRPHRRDQAEVAREDPCDLADVAGCLLGGALVARPGGDGGGEARRAASQLVAVDHVVLHHEGGVQDLDRGGDLDRCLVAGAAERLVRGHQQRGTEASAALGGVGEGAPQQLVARGGGGSGQAAAPAEESSDLVVHARRAGQAHEDPPGL